MGNFFNLRPLFVARQKTILAAKRIGFYQHFVPNGTKIERKYFYVKNIFM
jgi:hypothetical protein